MRAVKEWAPWLLLVTGLKVAWPGDRLDALETRMTRVEEMRGDVEAVALSLCLDQTNPIARQHLKCGVREAQAGIRR